MNNEDEEVINHSNEKEQTSNQKQDIKYEDTGEVDDISLEDVDTEGEVDTKKTIKKLREKVKKLEEEKKEYLDLSQRTRADYANYKKEVESNRVTDRKFATKKFIEQLLPVLDSYDVAKGNISAWESVDKNWRVGVEYIFDQLKKVLEGEGVVQFGKIGDTFNPNLHESIEVVTVDDRGKHDTIVSIMQSGYKMNDTVLRPARVKVGNFVGEKE